MRFLLRVLVFRRVRSRCALDPSNCHEDLWTLLVCFLKNKNKETCKQWKQNLPSGGQTNVGKNPETQKTLTHGDRASFHLHGQGEVKHLGNSNAWQVVKKSRGRKLENEYRVASSLDDALIFLAFLIPFNHHYILWFWQGDIRFPEHDRDRLTFFILWWALALTWDIVHMNVPNVLS